MAIRRKLFASIAMLMGFIFSTVAFASDLNMRPGVTETSIEAFDLHMQVIYVMTVIAIVVFGAMFYSFIFHRKSKNPKPATWSHSTKMEIIWTAIPVLILIYLTIPAIKLLLKMEESKTDADLTIQITGIQWKWEYMYPEQNITFISSLSTPRDQIDSGAEKGENYLLEVDNELVIPAGKTVRFLVTADDVIHSWWVPDLAVKKDAIPGFINEAWTHVPEDAIGTYRGQCTELCGKDHGFMPVVVKVVSQSDFDSWVAQKNEERIAAEKAAAEAAASSWELDKLMALGEEIYNGKGACFSCHKADGSGTPPLFPALKGSQMATQADQLNDHINIVVNGKSGTAMAAYGSQLTDAELAAVITYERNAWGNDTGDAIQPSQIQAFKAGN